MELRDEKAPINESSAYVFVESPNSNNYDDKTVLNQTPNPLETWKTQREVKLKKSKELEICERERIREAAEEYLDTFYAERSARIGKLEERNRDIELQSIEAGKTVASKNPFVKVCENINLSLDMDAEGKDKSRFRKVLLQWKNESIFNR